MACRFCASGRPPSVLRLMMALRMILLDAEEAFNDAIFLKQPSNVPAGESDLKW